jgi:hypothetical protein
MFQKSPIRSLTKRKKENKIRLVFVVNEDTYNMFAQLMEKRTEYYAAQIFSDLVRFGYKHGVYDERSFNARDMVTSDEVVESKKSKPANREDWCTKYGGTVNGIMCKYTKYEMTPTGHIVKATQALPLKQMPDSEDEFRKFLLGKFGTLGQAESAYENQSKKLEEPAERTIGDIIKKKS